MTVTLSAEETKFAIKVHILNKLGPSVGENLDKVLFVTDKDGNFEECRVVILE